MGALINEQTMTQADMILQFLQENGSITQAQAVEEFGCYRLGARIWDLKAAGHSIKRDFVTKKNRYGKAISFAKYSLMDGGVQA
ncbi:MAG: helix-turn-helix domain-containing protein [Oscillospiraceae bacterium]|nr:helix-turn-helix domain-containing protein [Oscillospiraceae bacterium]